MSRIAPIHRHTHARTSIGLAVGLALTLALTAVQEVLAQSTSIGPGIAGQVHALAVDPADSNVIYAGGDVCGAYVSRDFGASWELWNDGLDGRDLTRSYYVDDLLVLDETVAVHPARRGVYAATHGGIYRRPKSGGPWVLETDKDVDCRYAYEDNGLNPFVGSRGAPIPFSCFAYDPVDSVLYAGTGHGRYEWTAGGDRGYPQVPLDRIVLCSGEQYSVWSLDCSAAGLNAHWAPVLETANRGRVTQIAVSHHDGISEIAFACSSGLFSFGDPAKGTGSADLWQMRTQGFDTLGWSSRHWGVGAGIGGKIYCLAVGDSVNVGGTEVWRSPGVYATDLADPSGDWDIVGPLEAVVPPTSMTWNQICNHVTSDGKRLRLFTLTVRPGLGRLPGSAGAPLDELFVGEWTATLRSGYYRYGEYASGDTTAVGWTQPLYLTGGWNGFAYGSHDWFTNTTNVIGAGWCSNYAIFSTTPLAYSATNANRLVAANYHMPVVSDDGGRTWGQVYTIYDDDAVGHSTGLNLMVPVSAASTANGDVYLGSRDFGVFRTTQPLADDFHWLNWWHTGNPNAWNLAIRDVSDGQEVYVVRDAPAVANSTWALDPQDRPAQAIAMLSPEASDHQGVEEWHYISGGITAIYDGFPGYVPPDGTGASRKIINRYRIAGLAFQGSDTLFAGCEFQSGRVGDGPATTTCKVLRAVWSGGQWLWEELGIFPDNPLQGEIGRRQRLGSIATVARTSTVIVAAKEGYGGRGGLYAFSTDIPASATSGLRILLDGDSTTDEFLRYAARNVSALQVDRLQRFLYVGTQGLHAWDTTAKGWGTVLRCQLPVAEQSPGSWTVLANGTAPTFGYERPRYLFDGFAGDSDLDLNRRLTVINDIAVDPYHPERFWVAMGLTALAAPNGVWVHEAVGTWEQVVGGSGDGQPAMAGNVVELNGKYPDRLYAGIGGQEFFRTQTTISSHPDIAANASHPLLAAIADTVQVLAVHIAADTTVVTVEAELDSLGLPGVKLVLLDDGQGEDLAANDGVFTSPRFPALVTAGTGHSVRVFAQDATGGYDEREVAVEVVAGYARFVDVSKGTGDLYSSLPDSADHLPYSSIYFNATSDPASKKVMLITFDDSVTPPQMFERRRVQSETPWFERRSGQVYPAWIDTLHPGSRGLAAADFDNDANLSGVSDTDFLICNPASGGRLYRSHFAQGIDLFTDVTDSLFGDEVGELAGATTAAWGNFDDDGFVDLAVATTTYVNPVKSLGGTAPSGSVIKIFRNVGGVRFELLPYSGVSGGPNICLSLDWVDLDQDGDEDLVAWHYLTWGGTFLMLNLGHNEIQGQHVMVPSYLDIQDSWAGGMSACEIDYDHDLDATGKSYPDLLVTESYGQRRAMVLRNLLADGSPTLEFETVPLANGRDWSGAVADDFDLNGQLDALCLPQDGQPELRLGTAGGASPTYRDLAFTAGLRPGATSGALTQDFNDDSKPDLYLGRIRGDQFLYRGAPVGGVGAGSAHWLRVDLGTIGNSDRSLIGTAVTVTAGGVSQTRVVSGGGNRGGQPSNELLFGLGAAAGSAEVTVRYRSGEIDQFTTAVDTTVVAMEDQPVVLKPSTKTDPNPVFSYELAPGNATWVFRWRTVGIKGDLAQDVVHVENHMNYDVSDDCYIGIAPGAVRDLRLNDPGVTHTVYRSGEYWQHEVRWGGLPCQEDCLYRFWVTSGLGNGATVSSPPKLITPIDFCIPDMHQE